MTGYFTAGFLAGAALAIACMGFLLRREKRYASNYRAEIRDLLMRAPQQWMHDNHVYAGISLPGAASDLVYSGGALRIHNRGDTTMLYWIAGPVHPLHLDPKQPTANLI